MKKAGLLVFGFPVIVTIIIVFVYAYNMPYENWILLIKIVKTIFNIGIGLFVLWFMSKFFKVVGMVGSKSEHYDSTPEVEDNGFDPDSVEQLSGHTVKVKNKSGKTFLVSKGSNGNAAFQEIDKFGNRVGSPVVANQAAGRFGKEPNKALMEHMTKKAKGIYD